MYEVNEKLYAVCHNGIFPCVVRKICDDGIAVDIIQKHYVTETKYKWGYDGNLYKTKAEAEKAYCGGSK